MLVEALRFVVLGMNKECANSSDIRGTILWNLNFANPTLMAQGDERTAYSLVVPGFLGHVDINSGGYTERPLYWMLHDAVRPDVQLTSF